MLRITTTSLVLALVLAVTFMGCSKGSNNPVESNSNQELNLPDIPVSEFQGSRSPVGFYSMVIDPVNLTATIVPDREISTHFNLTGVLPVTVAFNSYDPLSGIVDIDVTVENSFNYDGYDLRLIVFQNSGHELINADSWTNLYDFPGGLPVNPFKSFAKTEPNRIFRAFQQHTEKLLIKAPAGNFNVRFAIDASWPGNCREPYEIGNFFQGYLADQTGDQTSAYVDVYDWQNNIDAVYLYCPAVIGQTSVMFTQYEGNKYKLNLTNINGASEGSYFGVIIAYSEGIALYLVLEIEVTQKKTIGTIYKDVGAFKGYTLFTPMPSDYTWLVDMDGRIVNEWVDVYKPMYMAYLLENGHLLRESQASGINGFYGKIREFDWDNNLVWEYAFSNQNIIPHHGMKPLPNGNVLLVAWEIKPRQEALDAGRKPGTISDGRLLPDAVYEIHQTGQSSGDIVWEWHSWDHMSSVYGGTANGQPVSTNITDPGKLNINYYSGLGADWLHCNSVDYNSELDQIVLSIHNFSELIVIDHSTADYDDPQSGIDAAKGPAGDILYRWGNPEAYGAGTQSDKVFFGQHDCNWIEPGLPGYGNILTFNNGWLRTGGAYSSIEEIVTPVDSFGNYQYTPGFAYGPESTIWTYIADPPASFYSAIISSARRLPNGNTLVCEGDDGHFFELSPDDAIVWEYINPVTKLGRQHQGTVITRGQVFKCFRYAPDYPAFTGRDMTPGDYVELPRL
jgi:hypothetical protein